MTRDMAIEIARRHAHAEGRSYYSEGFHPHEWVIRAILEAARGAPALRQATEDRPAAWETGEDTVCSSHPCAQHDFRRNASLNEDRYVCECEGFVPPHGCSGCHEAASDEERCVECPMRTLVNHSG